MGIFFLLNISYANLKMKHLAAFALLVLGGNESPSAADVEALLKKAGVSADSEKIEAMIKALEGKKFHEAVESGLAKMATMGGGGGASAGSAAAAKPVEEEKKDEPEDVDMGGLFGDEDDY